MKDKKGYGVSFLSAVCVILLVVIMTQAREIQDRNKYIVRELCEVRGLEYKTSHFDMKTNVYRVQCE